MSKEHYIPIPSFLYGRGMKNHGKLFYNHIGNWILSLGELCKYLSKEAENEGVEIFCGFPAIDLLRSEDKKRVTGVLTNSKGISKTGKKKPTFEDGVEIQADVTILAEGCRGTLKFIIL